MTQKKVLPFIPPSLCPPPPRDGDSLPSPRGGSPSDGPPPPGGGGGMDTTPDKPLTSAYGVEFMAGQLPVVGRIRIWD